MSSPSDFATRARLVQALLADESPLRHAQSGFAAGQLDPSRGALIRALLQGEGGHRSGYDTPQLEPNRDALRRALLQSDGGRRSGYDPNQPRVPAGNSDGGQWTSTGGTGEASSRETAESHGNGGDANSDGPGGDSFKRPAASRAAIPEGRFLDSGERDVDALSPEVPIQPVVAPWHERVRWMFGQKDLFGGGGGGGRPALPPYRRGDPTSGVLQAPVGPDIPLVSGTGGPAALMPRGSPGFNRHTRTHVEGHAAALMHQHGIREGTLHINNPAICPSCIRLLPYMLPPGAILNVVLPSGAVVRFVGVAR